MDFTVGIVSRNLDTMSNFVEFRDSRDFTFFEATEVVRDTWHLVSGLRGATCQAVGKSNMSPSVGPMWTHGMMPFEGNPIVDG